MKKLLKSFLLLALLVIMTACTGQERVENQINQTQDQANQTQSSTLAPVVDNLAHNRNDGSGELDSTLPTVYMTTDISPESLIKMYESLGQELGERVAVKIHSGEPGGVGNNHFKPEFIKDLVQSFDDSTIVECNTAYGGGRAETAMHKQVMIDNGFTAIAKTDIMDEEGYMAIPVSRGENIQENYVGTHFPNYDSWLILSHFKGHAMGGFGGALKNMSIGIAASEGKAWIHTSGEKMQGIFGGDQDSFLESMAEASGAVIDAVGGENIVYINVLNNISVDCDCMASPAPATMEDIGILASLDPVAIDQASVDLVYAAPDGQDVIERIESRNGTHILDYAHEIGIGSQEYNLVMLD